MWRQSRKPLWRQSTKPHRLIYNCRPPRRRSFWPFFILLSWLLFWPPGKRAALGGHGMGWSHAADVRNRKMKGWLAEEGRNREEKERESWLERESLSWIFRGKAGWRGRVRLERIHAGLAFLRLKFLHYYRFAIFFCWYPNTCFDHLRC